MLRLGSVDGALHVALWRFVGVESGVTSVSDFVTGNLINLECQFELLKRLEGRCISSDEP